MGEMIRQAKLASANHAVAQKDALAKQQGSQPGAAPSAGTAPTASLQGPRTIPPTGTWTGRQLCWRGAGWTAPTRPFSLAAPENWDLVGPYSGSLVFADGTFLDLPYLELFGGEAPGRLSS